MASKCVADTSETEARPQRLAARRPIDAGQPLMASKQVMLEFERVMRGAPKSWAWHLPSRS